ncbi:methyltransferase, partial [Patescibacteria group bacterium AH-259-L07]|nr:methyltransferase [Patescibacteria group bacterium AH-259-L07]
NLKTLEVYATSKEVPQLAVGSKQKELMIYKFKNPVLLTDNARIARLPALKRDAVIKLYEFPDRTVEYDGVSIHWSPILYPGVWAPSIDTIIFANAIRNHLIKTRDLKKIRSFLEIGTGSGFLSKYLLAKKKSLGNEMRLAHLTDINKDAIKSALDNIASIGGSTLIYYTHTQKNARLSVSAQYDLVIANPPYIPRSKAHKNNPYEGLFLYEEIIRNANKLFHAESIFMTNLSSLSKSFIKPRLENVFNLKTITKSRIPLKIPAITAGLSKESRDWIRYLKSKNILEEDKSERSGYRYWHTIEIVAGKKR